MKIAHLILAHDKPRQLERLIDRIAYDGDAIFIHLDKKADISHFNYLSDKARVYFIKKRVKVNWGAYTIVQATINGFEEIINSGTEYQYINLLSGADYPLQPPRYIHQFLDAHPNRAFMKYEHFEDWQEAISRVTKYHLVNYPFPGHYGAEWILNTLLPKRSMPGAPVMVGRSQWFTASIQCIKYIVNFWNTHPDVRRFTKFTWGPDEFIFQTILYNSPLRDCIVNDHLRYIDWSAGAASPKTLTTADADALLSSGKLFARKFDMTNHAAILDKIDAHLQLLSV
ncbi:glycosyl transferase [Mucilaginibacter sp. Bleaf8]|uniref:beta-1,6-N-acetylglucosaminyltransferase n=1 Tax=Mucilaginibacter sp. Bleaf8 TaxID=2834430 RepID=UPI001BD09EC4|nr:beta-1,6-N-acetylglucosaminyltransferase [Mucilaginibacter sp. Bleaf8]MBS7566252.1 glycosyl transferase [Mucilaginibacter sp. Bleaf8]